MVPRAATASRSQRAKRASPRSSRARTASCPSGRPQAPAPARSRPAPLTTHSRSRLYGPATRRSRRPGIRFASSVAQPPTTRSSGACRRKKGHPLPRATSQRMARRVRARPTCSPIQAFPQSWLTVAGRSRCVRSSLQANSPLSRRRFPTSPRWSRLERT